MLGKAQRDALSQKSVATFTINSQRDDSAVEA